MPKDAAYYRSYRKTPKNQAYMKAYRSTPEYRERQSEHKRRWRAKQRSNAANSAAQDGTQE